MARRRKSDPAPEAISPAVISPATEAVITKVLASEVIPTPDLVHAEKIRATLQAKCDKILAVMRRSNGPWPRSYVRSEAYVLADIARGAPMMDRQGTTVLSLQYGAMVYLIRPDQTSQFDQASGKELVIDVGDQQFVAIVLT